MTTPLTNPEAIGIHHHHAVVNGIRMHYVEKGQGPLVLLLHGFPEMWWSWRYQIVALAAAGFRVVAPDLRGYNDTEPDGPYDIDTLRDDVIGLLDHLRAPRAIVVAHDWGGAVAWHLASTEPGASRVERLVVMNCPHPAVFARALRSKWRQLARSWYMFFFQLPLVPERVLTVGNGTYATRALRDFAVDKTHFSTAEMAPFAAAVQKPGRAKGMVGWYRAAIRGEFSKLRGGAGAAKNSAPRYSPITVPTLLLWALEDRALGYDDVVPGTERYATALEIQTIPNCGHFLQQEQPEEVSLRLIDFLRRPTAKA